MIRLLNNKDPGVPNYDLEERNAHCFKSGDVIVSPMSPEDIKKYGPVNPVTKKSKNRATHFFYGSWISKDSYDEINRRDKTRRKEHRKEKSA